MHVLFEHAVVVVPHCPFDPHVTYPLPLVAHSCAPGVQTPTQAPPEHALFVHAVGVVPHCPFDPHVTYPSLPEHSFVPGVQTPSQTPALHTYVHGVPLTHAPAALHVCGVVVVPRHCTVFGTQLPLHAPLVQTYGHAAPLFCQVPLVLHFSG